MADPVEPLKALTTPNTGADVGAWGPVINGDFTAIGGMLGGVVSITAAGSNITLTAPTGSITPGGGPNQSQNAVLRFVGTLTANINVTLPLPGYYICEHRAGGAFTISLVAPGAGEFISLPNYTPTHIFSDGINVRFCNLGPVGAYLDLAFSSVPAWITNCTIPPYLLCDGTVYNISSFPELGSLLGATFGGNGSTTFGVPDLRARYRLPLGGSSGRVTNGVSGIDGTTIASSGGSQSLQSHNHTTNENPHNHSTNVSTSSNNTTNPSGSQPGAPSSGNIYQNPGQNNGSFASNFIANATTGITINSTGAGNSQNMPPTLVSGIALIKT